jgi:hypothetical protein
MGAVWKRERQWERKKEREIEKEQQHVYWGRVGAGSPH